MKSSRPEGRQPEVGPVERVHRLLVKLIFYNEVNSKDIFGGIFLPIEQGSLFLVYRGETSLLKTPSFQQTYKKLSQFYKKLNFDKIGAK